MRRAVEQRAHEFELIAQGALCGFALFDLAAHPGIPGQRQQQEHAGAQHDLQDQLVVLAPVGIGFGAVATPAAVDNAQFFRRDTQQCLVQNRSQLLGMPGGRHRKGRRIGADRSSNDQPMLGRQAEVGVDQRHDRCVDMAAGQ
ncbi:hypothetical protein D3C79_569710 [compost metagenome]